MYRQDAIKELYEHLEHWQRLLAEHICTKEEGTKTIKALQMAISDMRKLQYLTGRPCEVCSCHNEKGCGVWECMFDGKEVGNGLQT